MLEKLHGDLRACRCRVYVLGMGIKLGDLGESIVRKGGHDDISDDELLFLELVKRAPGMSMEDYKTAFVALREEFGEEALRAIQTGHVKFEKVAAEPKGGKS